MAPVFERLCLSKLFCSSCRLLKEGRALRGLILWVSDDKTNNVDFECPKKLDWIAETKIVPEQIDVVTIIKQRFEICQGCPNSKQNGFGCALWKKCCFGAWRSKATSVCPDTPPRWGKIERKRDDGNRKSS